MENRDRLLEAAIRVFAEAGFRGATTRRIAEEAGVNEVTLFRLFKSKIALIREAAQHHAQLRSEFALPAEPKDPERELVAWCVAQLAFLRKARSLIRKCLAEVEEHPEMAQCMRHGPTHSHLQLRRYAHALCRQQHIIDRGGLVDAASTMLAGALFADAMGREFTPEMYPPERRAAAQYARCFLRALGVAPIEKRNSNGNGRSAHRSHAST
jgi:AcrR family transcriptional regulator